MLCPWSSSYWPRLWFAYSWVYFLEGCVLVPSVDFRMRWILLKYRVSWSMIRSLKTLPLEKINIVLRRLVCFHKKSVIGDQIFSCPSAFNLRLRCFSLVCAYASRSPVCYSEPDPHSSWYHTVWTLSLQNYKLNKHLFKVKYPALGVLS